ncbi:MAG: hypothetical protein WCP23_10580 [Planctomycetota bacterium]
MLRHLFRVLCAGGLTVASIGASVFAEDAVAVLITGPLAAKVGERVSFEVEIVNRSGRPLDKLRIVDYFDKGYHHEASVSPIEQKGTIDLAAGTSRRMTLDFLLDEPGRQCHRVEILDQAHAFMGGATSCVQVAAATPSAFGAAVVPSAVLAAPIVATPLLAAPPLSVPPVGAAVPLVAPASPPLTASAPPAAVSAAPSLELGLTGPSEVMADSVAEYVAVVRNTGIAASGPTTLEFIWGEAYVPLEASDGYTLGTSAVSWNLPSIDPGAQLRRQINLRAQSPATYRKAPSSRSCVRSVLSGMVGGVMVADESCVMIRSNTPLPRSPREAGLRLSLADCDDPVQAGSATKLVCTVSNNGTAPSGRLDLVIVLPDQARLVGDPTPSRVRIDGSNITFDSIPSIAPGSHTAFELSYRMPIGSVAKATAIASGAEIDGSFESTCTTTFVAP